MKDKTSVDFDFITVALTVKRGRRDASWLITVAEISQQIAALAKPFAGNQTILMIVLMIIVVSAPRST
jgi:TRAP-type C4-dicarboxylate transport system permease large subunit